MSQPVRSRIAPWLVGAAVLLGACGSAAPEAAPAPVTDDGGDTQEAPRASSDDDTEVVAGDYGHPVLTATAFAPDGSPFTIGDHAGKTIFVETFATWCSNCRRQLGDTNVAAGMVDDDVVFLVLSIENNLEPARLAEYAADNGFDNVVFGVLSPEALAAINDQFGRAALTAPSTPKFIVSPDGSLSELTTGFESVDEILAQVA